MSTHSTTTGAIDAAIVHPEITRISIDRDGDLVLRVGEELKEPTEEFLVCSSALRRVSPVFKRMLFGAYREAQEREGSKRTGGEWLVVLPEDDPTALRVLLGIAHSAFQNVPAAPGVDAVYQIMLLVNKYDLAGVVRPWATAWRAIAQTASSSKKVDERAKALYIALILGAEVLCRQLAVGLALDAVLDDQGCLLVEKVRLFDEFSCFGPFRIEESIRELRTKRIHEIWTRMNTFINGNLQDKSPDFRFLGLFWSTMVQTRGDLLPKSPATISESANELLSSLRLVSEKIAAVETPRGVYSSPSKSGLLKEVLNHPAQFGQYSYHQSNSSQYLPSLSPADTAFMRKQMSKTGCGW